MKKNILIFILVAVLILVSCQFFTTNTAKADTNGTVLLFSTQLVNEANWMTGNLGIFRDVFQSFGYTVREKYSSTTEHHLTDADMQDINLVVICTPYILLNDTDISLLEDYLDTGGRIVMQGEYAAGHIQDNAVLTDATIRLGGDFVITETTSNGSPVLVGTSGFNSDSALLNNVLVGISNGCIADIEYHGSAEAVLSLYEGDIQRPYVVDQAVGNGRITAITDANFYTDATNPGNQFYEDTRTFIQNWLLDSMQNQQTVAEGQNPNSGFGGSPEADPGDDDTTPIAGGDYVFTIIYNGYEGAPIDINTIGINDIFVRDENGNLLFILSAEIIDQSNPSSIEVRYTIQEPIGGWVIGDVYTVGIVNASVADINGVQIGGNNNVCTITVKTPECTVSFEENGGSTVEAVTVAKNNAIDAPEEPTFNGYDFVMWCTDEACTQEYDFDTLVNNDFTLYAKWTPKIYQINYNLDNGTNNANNPDSYTIEDATITLSDPTKIGYIFEGWAEGNTIAHGSTGDKDFTASWSISEATITYDPNGGTGSATDTAQTGKTIELHNGEGFTNEGYILEGWTIDNTDYLLGEVYTMGENDLTATAIWLADKDNDGTCDDDETALGTNPDVPSSTASTGTINGRVMNSDGSPAGGMIVVLNSTPIKTTTDADGNFNFINVPFSQHTLTLRDGMDVLGTYKLNFAVTSTNSTKILDNAATDSIGSLKLSLNNNATSISLTVQQNDTDNWQLGAVSYEEKSENPKTGYDYNFEIYLILLFALILTAIAVIKHRHQNV